MVKFDNEEVNVENLAVEDLVDLLQRADDMLSSYTLLLALLTILFDIPDTDDVKKLLDNSYQWAGDVRTTLSVTALESL